MTAETVAEMDGAARTLQSYKLPRLSREIEALAFRLRSSLQRGSVSADTVEDRLARISVASRALRSLIEDPQSHPVAVEELSGHTWREKDLDGREDLPLLELAWESERLEEGFRMDTSYLLAPDGEVLCERKIVPLGLTSALDDSLKPRRTGLGLYRSAGLYPGDLPRRVRPGSDSVRLSSADGWLLPPSRAALQGFAFRSSLRFPLGQMQSRLQRAFPPAVFPAVIDAPLFTRVGEIWHVSSSDGVSVPLRPAPGLNRQPEQQEVMSAFVDAAFSAPFWIVLLLFHESNGRIAAMPAGGIVGDRIICFGLDQA